MAQATSPTAPGAPGTDAQYVASTVASGFNQPFGIAVNTQGQLYLADSGNDRIVRMNTNGSDQTTVATLGAFSQAYGVAVDSNGEVLWTDAGLNGQQVTIMLANGADQTLIGPTNDPLSVAVDENGVVYSNLNYAIASMTEAGADATTIVSGLTAVYNIAVDDSGHLFIPEWPSNEIIKVNTNGTDPTEIVDTPGLGQAAGIAVDNRGHLFVTEQGLGQVVELNDDGSDYHAIATGLDGPFGVAVDGAGNVYVAERDSGVVEELSPENPVPEYGSADLTWSAPASNGGAAIRYYTVVATPTAGPAISSRFAGTATSGTIYGLKNATSYAISISATNSVGTGPISSYSATVTTGVPDQMAAPRAAPGTGLVKLGWQAPYNGNDPLDGYVVSVTPVGGTSFTETFSPSSTAGVIRGLTDGTRYTFAIKAEADNGDGAWSRESSVVVPARVPSVPTRVTATAANKAATVHWKAPSSNGGAALTGFIVTTVGSKQTCIAKGSALACTVHGLTNGTHYRFRVEARNDIGTSAPSAASNSVVPKG
jgi:hypothetical protein